MAQLARASGSYPGGWEFESLSRYLRLPNIGSLFVSQRLNRNPGFSETWRAIQDAQTEWDYTQERPYKGDVIKDKRRIYIHYFYSIEKGAEDEQAFDKRIAGLCRELLEDKPVESHRKAYEQFFEVKTTPKRGRQVYYKEDAIKEARRYLGYFAIITNETMDAFTALHLYRMKDVVEKAIGNIKERLNMRRLLVSSENRVWRQNLHRVCSINTNLSSWS